MTPKEKAKELIERFKKVEVVLFGCAERGNPCIISGKMLNHATCESALICVDEIINLCAAGLSETKYWLEVRKEIELLK